MRSQHRFIAALGTLLLLVATPLRADDVANKGREIFNRNQRAIVTVQVVIRASSSGGRSSENRQEVTGTVVDPSGLTVLALSACDPAEMYRRLSDDYKVEVEVRDVKILLSDSTEVPAEIVLRDKDLDLAFIRPKTKPANLMNAIDLENSGSAQVLDNVITLNRLNKAASRAYSASVERISAVIQKPRTFYIPDGNMSNTTLGAPAFSLDGKIVGIFVMRAVSGGGSAANVRQNLTAIILPAEDILKAAKQAPEARGGDENGDGSETPKDESEAP